MIVAYDETSLTSESTSCEITSQQSFEALSTWVLGLSCTNEGYDYLGGRVIMYEDYADEIWEWYGSGFSDPVRLYRCD